MAIKNRMNDHNPAKPPVTSNIQQVSIGMPVYNGAKFIHEALDSLLAQTFTDFELIISDNASTDETEAICREYAAKDSRIRYVRQSTNLGAVANFKFVLDEAVGEYFMWAAADDVWRSKCIEHLIRVFDKNNHFCCVMSDVENIYQNSKNASVISELFDIRLDMVTDNWKGVRKRFFRNPTSNIYFCIYGLFKTGKLKKVDLNYRGMVKYLSASEIPFLAQLAILGQIGSIAEPLKIYRRHDASVFHQEQLNLQTRDRLFGFINVSYVLVQIISDSSLSVQEKIVLYVTVFSTGFRWFISFTLHHFLRPALKFIDNFRK